MKLKVLSIGHLALAGHLSPLYAFCLIPNVLKCDFTTRFKKLEIIDNELCPAIVVIAGVAMLLTCTY